MNILGVIPARYASSRFPGKPLVDIAGLPMIQRVYEQVVQCELLTSVVVATDDKRIAQTVNGFGGKVVMTSELHQSGTDRCFEALQLSDGNFDAVINIQGDEPYIQPAQITMVANCFKESDVQISTLAIKINNTQELENTNMVKVLQNAKKEAIYFSRQPIPFLFGKAVSDWASAYPYLKHVGIYGYRSDILKEITALKRSPLEIAESLEQLRWLDNGYKIRVEITDIESLAIDTPEDLEKLLQKKSGKK